MFKNQIKKLINAAGYDVVKIRKNRDVGGEFELYQYCRQDGSFDYDKYKKIQVEGNKNKINQVWVLEENIAFLSKYLNKKLFDVSFGICHGTRRGDEQAWFRKYLGCEVIGTEISDTAEQFPDTIQWDFHDVKPEWIDSVGFIYSNAFDHSYDPEKCLNTWMSCVKKGGVCILEHTSGHERATELDPFGAHISAMPYLVLTWGKGAYCVTDLLKAPLTGGIDYIYYIVIQKL
jgi:hypothetical protein